MSLFCRGQQERRGISRPKRRPDHYSILLKCPGKAVHHTRNSLQRMFSFHHFQCTKEKVTTRGDFRELQNILPCPAPPKHCSRPLHHEGCERSHFNPEVTTCVIMCYQVTYYISCRLLILVSFTKRQLWKQLNLNYLWRRWLGWSASQIQNGYKYSVSSLSAKRS